jgi:hypothetical protein
VHYEATLGADGAVSKVEISLKPAAEGPGAPTPLQATLTFAGDTATVVIHQADSTQTIKVPAHAGVVPVLSSSYAFFEQLIMQARRSGKDSLPGDLLAVGNRNTFPTYVRKVGSDSVIVSYFGFPAHVKTDKLGRLLGWDGRQTTVKVLVDRLPNIDVEAATKRFAAADLAGHSLGQISPRDTVSATVGGAQIWVDYGRPSARGRTIFGVVVPWGQVWRTGANAATQFSTDKDLTIGGAAVPAGKYTLWTLPTESGAKLIINKQTGQWGTAYDETQDLVRIDLNVAQLSEPVERFTIGVDTAGNGGVLTFSWDRTRYSVPLNP